MTTIDIPVRYYKDYPGGYDYGYETLPLPLSECAFLLVDVDGTAANPVTEGYIAPALEAARQVRGTSVNPVDDVENVLVTAGTGVPTSALLLSVDG